MNNAQTTTNKTSDLSLLRNMIIGQEREFPISKLSNVRTMCSNFGIQWGVKFTTRTDKEKGVVIVTRIA